MMRGKIKMHNHVYKKALLVFFAIVLVLMSIPAVCFAEAGDLIAFASEQEEIRVEEPLIEGQTGTSIDTNANVSEGNSSSTLKEQANDEQPETAPVNAAPSLLSSASTRSASGSVGTLSVQLSNSADAFEDIDTFTDGITDWFLGDLRTLHVDFEFGTGSEKAITITVPTGYQIVGYSATDDTPTQDGLQNISIDPQYIDYFQSSNLIGIDGTTAWEQQSLPDSYLPRKSTVESEVRTFGGIASYTFSDSTTKGLLVMTIKPHPQILSHTAKTELLDSITIQMSSSQGSASNSFRGNITGLSEVDVEPGNTGWGYEYANVTYDSETGLSGQFGILSNVKTYRWDNAYGAQNVYMQSWTSTITYPKGVSFDNKIFCDYFRLGDVETTGGEIVANHCYVEVTGDKTTGGTVTFTFTNTTFYHSSGENAFGAYFTADTSLTESEDLIFTVTTDINNRNKTLHRENNRTRHLISGDGNYLINITPSNEYRRDYNTDYPDYPYEYAIGAFEIVSELPYTDVPFAFDFSCLNGVRGVGAPGYNIRNIVATTTEGRSITLDSVPGTSDGYYAVPITPEQLGLYENEYLTELSFVADLEQLKYNDYYACGISYFGHFVDGQEGDVVLSVLDKQGMIAPDSEGNPITATDHTTIRWENSGGFWMSTRAWNEAGEDSTFHPNEMIHFNSFLNGGTTWSDADTLIDPIIMISLPKGINLDTSSVLACSEYGNHPNETISLRQVKTPLTMTIDGVEWTTYYYTSPEPLDMVAMEKYAGTENSGITIDFETYVSSNVPEYGQISLKDCVQWDLGADADVSYDWVDLAYQDVYNRAGHGTDYYVEAIGDNFTVKPLIGLNVDLGIRVKGSGTDFFTYDTTENSIAALTKTQNAEVRISYENTASTDYFQGSAIYLPIPRIGNDFSKYFQNIELKDPVNTTNNKIFEFNTYLATQVSLSGFTTYYSVNATENSTAYDPSINAATWVPVAGTWYTYNELSAAGYSLSDVTMLKLVANNDIPSGDSANATFELAIDSAARIGQLDYWRAYSKAITDNSTNTGIWNYSSVLAATPSSDGLYGQIFIDTDYDGFFNTSAGDLAYTSGLISAILSRDDGTMANLELVVNADGSFRSLNENGTTYQLRPGNYTITFTETDETYLFSGATGSNPSSEDTWYNNLRPQDIEGNKAEYHFTIDESNELGCYVGIAMTDFVEVISVDVPVRVIIAVNTDGSWATPTALNNKIINRSTCSMHVASAIASPVGNFSLVSAATAETTSEKNVLTGTITANGGAPQNLLAVDTSDNVWSMPPGLTQQLIPITDGSNELALQLAGFVRNVEGKYLTAPVNAFNITYTFEKAGA